MSAVLWYEIAWYVVLGLVGGILVGMIIRWWRLRK